MSLNFKSKNMLKRDGSSILSDDNVDVDPQTSDDLLNNSSNLSMKYTLNYRFVKTALLIFAWVSYSVNFEMIGPTFEDLRHYLECDYTSISFGLVLRNLGFLVFTFIFGLVFDRVAKFSELLLAISSFIIAISKQL